MAGTDNAYLLEIVKKLQPSGIEDFKYILKQSLTGKIH